MAFELVQKASPPVVTVGSGFRHFTVAVPSIEAALQRAMARGADIVEGSGWEAGEVYIRVRPPFQPLQRSFHHGRQHVHHFHFIEYSSEAPFQARLVYDMHDPLLHWSGKHANAGEQVVKQQRQFHTNMQSRRQGRNETSGWWARCDGCCSSQRGSRRQTAGFGRPHADFAARTDRRL